MAETPPPPPPPTDPQERERHAKEALDRRCTIARDNAQAGIHTRDLAGLTGVVLDVWAHDWSTPEAAVLYHIVLDSGDPVTCIVPSQWVELGPVDTGAVWWRAKADKAQAEARRWQDLVTDQYQAHLERGDQWCQAMRQAGLDVHIL